MSPREVLVDLHTKLISELLASTKDPRLACQSLFALINQGRMDITRRATTANKLLYEDEIRELAQGYMGLVFADDADGVHASGSWMEVHYPVNEVFVSAERSSNLLKLHTKIASSPIEQGSAPMLIHEDTAIPIEIWSKESIRSEKSRVGKSDRFVQYVIDRQAKSVSMIFTGDQPAPHALGDNRAGINRHLSDLQKKAE